MQESNIQEPSKGTRIAGIVLTALVTAALLFSGGGKIAGGEELVKGFEHLGLPLDLRIPLAIIEIACAVIFAIPRTSFLGAILVTGYMGGAMLTHLRIGEPVFVQFLVGVFAWVGYGLRRPGVIRAAFR